MRHMHRLWHYSYYPTNMITTKVPEKLTGIIAVLSIFLLVAAHINTVNAQPFSFTLQPAYNQVIARPGSSAILPYTLTNTGDPTVVTLKVYFLSMKDSTGSYELIPYNSDIPNLPQFTTSDSALNLNEPFLIASQEAIEFDLIMTTAAETEERDYYFTFVVESEPSEGFEDTSRIILQSGIGSNIYLSVSTSGSIQSAGEITQFTVQPQYTFRFGNHEIALFDSYQPVPLLLTVANKGERIFQTSGTITVERALQRESLVISIPKQHILANSQRLINATSIENIRVSETSTALLPSAFIGAYTASTNLQIGTENTQTNVSTHFYVFPFKYTLYLLIVFFAIMTTPFIIRSFKK